MNKYIVRTKEVHAYEFSVNAESKEEALKLVKQGQGEEVANQDDTFLYLMDENLWDAEEEFERGRFPPPYEKQV